MKNLLFIAVAGLFLFSCGEEGVGFNARKEVGVTSSMEIPGVAVALPGDVPERRQDITFELEDVTTDLDFLDEIILNSLSYEITGIDSDEELDIDELSINLQTSTGSIEIIRLTSLANTDGKVQSNLSSSDLLALQNQIFIQKEADGTIFLDLIGFPNEDLEFDIVTYFDVTAKIRDL